MIESIFSPHWYRVKSLKPGLKSHVELHCHDYRDETWYVLQDHANGRHHRFSTAAYQFIGMMDKDKSVQQIWHEMNNLLGDDSLTQEEVISIMGQLHRCDALHCNVTPSIEELFERGEKRSKAKRASRFKNPIAMRFSICDPDKFLDATARYVRWLFSWQMLLICCLFIIAATIAAGVHFPQLRHAISLQSLQTDARIALVVVYPVLKLLHELGHAYAVKLEGGEVHDMGIMLLVLLPIPYVDASASISFREKRKRMLVSAAGIIVELTISALALFLWLAVEPSTLRNLALQTVLVGGVSTLLFNGNPLLRYDAYYLLADAIGIPNLAQRSNQYIGYLIQRYLFGMTLASTPITSRSERAWFAGYSICSFAYRSVLMIGIAIYLAGKFFVLGMMLAAWVLISQFALPLKKHTQFLFSSAVRPHRHRAFGASAAVISCCILFFTLIPVPSNSQFEGVVWLPGENHITSKVDAVISRVLVQPGQRVLKGQGIIELEDPFVEAQLKLETARVAELDAEYNAKRVTDKVKAAGIKKRLVAAKAKLERAREKVDALLLTSPSDGNIYIPHSSDLPGSYVTQGTTMAYIMDDANARAQVLVSQHDVDRIHQRLDRVQFRFAQQPHKIYDAAVLREVPQATSQLPNKVLSIEGGGRIAVKPDDAGGLQSMESLFQYELSLPQKVQDVHIGSRVYVRFDHGNETFATQSYRRIRQLFIRQFNV